MNQITLPLTAALTVALLALTGCTPQASSPVDSTAPAAQSLEVSDAWAKAADGAMTAAFATLKNTGSAQLTIESAITPAASRVELHETVDSGTGTPSMRKKDGGFTIAAGRSQHLAPGGDHLMLMGLTAPLAAGDSIEITLTLSDGSTTTFSAMAKEFAGAGEEYSDGMTSEMGH
ncbi:copper chaperone PCu(A)C [soil metagenome]